MLARKQKWLLIGLVTLLILAGGALKFWQSWQRSHFDCQGEMQVFAQDSRADITLRYIFNGDKGVAILRGVVASPEGEPLAIDHNVWFSFTREGDDFFLRSQNITSNVSGAAVSPGLAPMLPVFYLQAKEPFYLRIVRSDSNSRLLFTSRLPSLFCKF